jgi:hypothetical protein
MKTKSTNIDIAFILLPPSSTTIPSPAFSYLKGFLDNHGTSSEIIYANHLIEIDNEFFKEGNTSETEALLPFLYRHGRYVRTGEAQCFGVLFRLTWLLCY